MDVPYAAAIQEACSEENILQHGHVKKYPGILMHDSKANCPRVLRSPLLTRFPRVTVGPDCYVATGVALVISGEHLYRCRFAGTILTHQAVDRSRSQVDIKTAQRNLSRESLPNPRGLKGKMVTVLAVHLADGARVHLAAAHK